MAQIKLCINPDLPLVIGYCRNILCFVSPIICGAFCVWPLYCYTDLSIISSFAIILLMKRVLVSLLQVSSCCQVADIFMCLFLSVTEVCMQCVIMAFL